MFVGYEVKSNQNQAKSLVLEKDINLTQAVLDPSSVKNKNKEPVCLVVEYNKKQFIIAVIDPGQTYVCPINLMFAAGSLIKLFIRGSGSVHLTGYEQQDFDDDIDMSESEDSDEAESSLTINKKEQANKSLTGSGKKAAITNGHNKASPNKKNSAKKVDRPISSSSDSDDEDYLNFGEENDDSDEEMFEDDDEDDDDNDDLGDLDDDDSEEESSEDDE